MKGLRTVWGMTQPSVSSPAAPSSRGGARPIPVLEVDDWEALDAQIAGFLMDKSLSPETHKGYLKLWRLWKSHCEALRPACDPRDAPWAAWQDLAKFRRQDGLMYNRPHHLEAVLNAVRWRYETEGIDTMPAPLLPAHRSNWKALCRNYRIELSEAGEGELVSMERPPMLRADIGRLISVPPESIPFVKRVGETRDPLQTRAEMLVALDTGMTATQVCSLTWGDFAPQPDGSVHVQGHVQCQVLPCDHVERAVGVPWDCSACAVHELLVDRDPQSPFVTAQHKTVSMRHMDASRRWPGLDDPDGRPKGDGTRMFVRDGITDRELAGLRRGIVLISAINPMEATWILGRAWLSVSWEAGFRMVSDLAHLPRGAVSFLPDGSGVVLTLGGTKDDPAGAKRVSRVFTYRDGPCAAQALTEYVVVRDAAVGDDPDTPLFTTSRGSVFGPNWRKGILKPVQVANAAIARLAQAAAIDTNFTTYSARRGYATQSAQDGRHLEEIRAGLRHKRSDTTLRYTDRSAQTVPAKLAAQLDPSIRDTEGTGHASQRTGQ